ncbi:glycoside hydrolase domain-containing protein [Puia sp. P3]|uniref:glycoside hydrolase domain-containing protein n=1 Tax=Puia sp. P3 TaxID=3423952 RepID=UPI003D676F6E
MDAELPGWDFTATANAAKEKWNRELSKVELTTTDEKARRIFYTALYHTMIDPALFNDAGSAQNTYSVFSLWDTYRAENPLLTILQPNRAGDMVRTMIDISHRQKLLPIWHLEGNETGTMVGVSSLQIIAEAILKDLKGFNKDSAWAAINAQPSPIPSAGNMSATAGRSPTISSAGRSPAPWNTPSAKAASPSSQNTSANKKTMNTIASAQKTTGYTTTKPPASSAAFPANPATSPASPPTPATSAPPSIPLELPRPGAETTPKRNAPAHTSGSHPRPLRPHEPPSAANKISSNVSTLFSLHSHPYPIPTPLADITGTIGQYAHGNEPSHHIAYLYAYAGRHGRQRKRSDTF